VKISDNNAESGKVPRMLAAFPRWMAREILSFDIKFVIFSQELLCKLSIFFTHRLASTKAYQKKKIKAGVVILKIIDDVIIRRWKDVNISKVLKNMHFLKTWLTCSPIFLEIHTYSFIEFIPNITNALYIRFLNSFSHQVSNNFPFFCIWCCYF
jgi:hypothetical protein